MTSQVFYFRQFFRALYDYDSLKKAFFNLEYLCDVMTDCFETLGYVYLALKADFQSVLRRLGVCFRFCFEFGETLHFGVSIHEVF